MFWPVWLKQHTPANSRYSRLPLIHVPFCCCFSAIKRQSSVLFLGAKYYCNCGFFRPDSIVGHWKKTLLFFCVFAPSTTGKLGQNATKGSNSRSLFSCRNCYIIKIFSSAFFYVLINISILPTFLSVYLYFSCILHENFNDSTCVFSMIEIML